MARTCRFEVSNGQLVKKRCRQRAMDRRIGLRRRQGAGEGEWAIMAQCQPVYDLL
jgi:hypothetical protein